MMKKKSNKAEIEERILYVLNLLLEGKKTKDICRIATGKWNISRRQVERYITSSYKLLHKEFENILKNDLVYHMALRMHLYSISYEKGNYRTCLEIMKDLAKLQGLYDNNANSQVIDIVVKLPEDLESFYNKEMAS